MNRVSCSSTFERYARFVLDGFFGKTSQERSQAKAGRLSDSCCPKWTNSGTAWRGGYLMRSSSEWPKDGAVSFLSDVMEPAPPVEVLLEPESMRGDYPSSREAREALAADAGRGAACAGFKYYQGAGAGGLGYEHEVSPTCTADWHNPAVLAARQNLPGGVCIQGSMIGRKDGNGPQGSGVECDGASFTLNCTDRHAVLDEGPICMADDNTKAAVDDDMCGSLKVGGGPPIVATRRTCAAPCAPGTAGESGGSLCTKGRW